MRFLHYSRKRKAVVSILGEGISGKVELYEKNGMKYVIKTYHDKEQHETRREYKNRVLHEYRLLATLDHQNIIRVFKSEVSASGLKVKVFLEAGSPNLNVLLNKHEPALDPDKLLLLWKQVCEGVRYLHERELCHRDLKLENLVMSPDYTEIRIIDFMTAFECRRPAVGIVGSCRYMAPEMWSKISYEGKSVDMWSLGILLYRFLTRKYPWRQAVHLDPDFKMYAEKSELVTDSSNVDKIKTCAEIIQKNIPLWEMSPDPELVSHLLDVAPSERYVINQLFSDRWFTSIQTRISDPFFQEG